MERLIHALMFSGLFSQSFSLEYVLIQQPKTWDEAQVYCKQNYFGNLVTVKSSADWENVQGAVQPALTSAVWTGLYNDISSWRWSYQDENLTFSTWNSGEPNNNNGKQECGFIFNGAFNDISCNIMYPFVCYNEQQTGPDRFVIYRFTATWHQAQSYCTQHHTDLVTIRNQAELDQVLQIMGGNDHIWIGLCRDSWKWLDGEIANPSSIFWNTGQPDLTGTIRPCAAADPGGQIDDRPCTDALPFICQNYRKKQIVRVKVKSGLTVNDAAVMETVLQWINQKLKDQGIEKDTSLKWRLQPDGNVFSTKYDRKDAAEEFHINQEDCSGVYY